MKKFKLRLVVLLVLAILTHSCTSDKKVSQDDEFGTDSAEVAAESTSGAVDESELALDNSTKPSQVGEAPKDEFSDFEKPADNAGSSGAVADAGSTTEADLEKELNSLDDKPAANQVAQASPEPTAPVPTEKPADSELSLDDAALAETPAPEAPQTPPAPEVAAAAEPAPLALPQDQTPAPPPAVQVPEIAVQPPPVVEQPPVPMAPKISQINSVQYQSNQSGGTVVINSTEPLQFTTRMNPATHQLVVEVQNSVIPKKLKRSLNTKDMASSIGSVDIYQKANSNVSRFVVQLRPGSPEPLVQPEGTSLLIVGAANPTYVQKSETLAKDNVTADPGSEATQAFNPSPSSNNHASTAPAVPANSLSHEVNPDLTSEGIMDSQSLEDFLANNNKFYGKKISIEANKLDVNEALKFLAEESGVNMMVDEGIGGDVTLKLRQVPWDQAFVLLLKSKKLGYKRQGNVIRVASIATLKAEEDDAVKLLEARKIVEPLVVKRFFIGYADIGELEKKIKDFISTTTLTATGAVATTQSRGKVISDARTNSLIVTETADNLQKIEKLVAALDTQPKQVLIEGKVVEAKESFVRGLGVKWGSDPSAPAPAGNAIRPSVGFDTSVRGSGIFSPSVGIGIPGSPGDFGNLTATLNLGETEDKLRVLSSPRISVLSSQSASISQTLNVLVDKVNQSSGTGVTTSTKEYVGVGVTLNVTPQVSNEGTVVMDLSIERSFLSAPGSEDVERRNAKTKVIVRSGQTAVIGGIFQVDTSDGVSGIPFFKDIPIFGALFRGNNTSRTKNELVIFVTPKIQKPVQGDSASVTSFK